MQKAFNTIKQAAKPATNIRLIDIEKIAAKCTHVWAVNKKLPIAAGKAVMGSFLLKFVSWITILTIMQIAICM